MQIATPLLFLAGLGAGAWLGARYGRGARMESHDCTAPVALNSDLIEKRVLLEHIRTGRAMEMVESLEFAVDGKVLSLAEDLEKMHPFTRNQVLQTLQLVKKYRKAWPRDPAPASWRSEELRSTAQELARDAERVLAGLQEPTE